MIQSQGRCIFHDYIDPGRDADTNHTCIFHIQSVVAVKFSWTLNQLELLCWKRVTVLLAGVNLVFMQIVVASSLTVLRISAISNCTNNNIINTIDMKCHYIMSYPMNRSIYIQCEHLAYYSKLNHDFIKVPAQYRISVRSTHFKSKSRAISFANEPMTDCSSTQSFWNFWQSTAVSLPWSVQDFRMIQGDNCNRYYKRTSDQYHWTTPSVTQKFTLGRKRYAVESILSMHFKGSKCKGKLVRYIF